MLRISNFLDFNSIICSFNGREFCTHERSKHRITMTCANIDSSICRSYRFREVSLPTSVDVDVAAIIFITLKKRVGRGRKIEAILHIAKISKKRLHIQIP